MQENRYLLKHEITSLNIDVNSVCNAACVGCARSRGSGKKNIVFDEGKHLSLNTWKKIIDEIGQQLQVITFCGNYGDAGATYYLPEIVDYALANNSKLHIVIVSNMGINSTDFWTRLGNFSSKNLEFQCSIDGLEDTNHIYRRFVRWEKVIKNAKALIATGANVDWKWIRFFWNEHQIEEAKQLANEMGFRSIIFTPNNDPTKENYYYSIYEQYKNVWMDTKSYHDNGTYTEQVITNTPDEDYTTMMNLMPAFDSIDCYTKDEKSIHIDWNGDVYPCCWYGGAVYNNDQRLRNAHATVFPSMSTKWNSVQHYTIEEILETDFFKNKLMDSLNKKPSPVCALSCGKCNDKWNVINTIGKGDQSEF